MTAESENIEIGSPVRLFEAPIGGALQGYMRQQYDVSRDGGRFLMSDVPESSNSVPISVILNWNPEAE